MKKLLMLHLADENGNANVPVGVVFSDGSIWQWESFLSPCYEGAEMTVELALQEVWTAIEDTLQEKSA